MKNKLPFSPKYPVDTILKAAALIEVLRESEHVSGIKVLSQKVGLSSSTTHRLLDTLVSIGYVERNPDTHQYKLGIGLLRIGLYVLSQYGMNPDVRIALQELADATGETAKLSVLFNGKMVYVGIIESSNPLRDTGHIGSWGPIHCTAMGKVLLSALSLSDQEIIISSLLPLKQYTPKTITNKEELLIHVENVRKLGYAVDDEEFLIGSRGIASPVINPQGELVAAVSISGPSARLSFETIIGYLPFVKKASKQLSSVTTL